MNDIYQNKILLAQRIKELTSFEEKYKEQKALDKKLLKDQN